MRIVISILECWEVIKYREGEGCGVEIGYGVLLVVVNIGNSISFS